MIRKLRRKISLLVTAVLILISAGIVFSINTINWNHVKAQAESVLEIIAENSGARPSASSTDDASQTAAEEESSSIIMESITLTGLSAPDETGQVKVAEQMTGGAQPDRMSDLEAQTQEVQPKLHEGEDERMNPPQEADSQDSPPANRQQEDAKTPEASSLPEIPEAPVPGSTIPQYETDSAEAAAEEPETEDSETQTAKKKPAAAGQPVETETSTASLSNYYVVYLAEDNTIQEWVSDRAELYSDTQVADLTALALASGRENGYIGSQFYKFTEQNGQKMLIVLDARVEVANAKSVLHTTILIAAAACLLLSAAAYVLIRKMLQPVQSAFEKQKQFVWDASHELKTPLAVIGANAEVLEMEIGENEYLGYIRSEVKRTGLLVKDLLTLARMDQGTLTADIKPLNFSDAVLSVALPFESKAFEDEKEFIINVPTGIRGQGDESMLKQLTVILLSNAFKYSDDKGRISLQLSRRGSGAELEVRNTGGGIRPEDKERIFERFYRGDLSHNRKTEGFGFGLSIAKSIVENHHGKIRVFSSPQGETAFNVYIPG